MLILCSASENLPALWPPTKGLLAAPAHCLHVSFLTEAGTSDLQMAFLFLTKAPQLFLVAAAAFLPAVAQSLDEKPRLRQSCVAVTATPYIAQSCLAWASGTLLHAASVAPPAPPLLWQYCLAVMPFLICGLSVLRSLEPRPMLGPSALAHARQVFSVVSCVAEALQIAFKLLALTLEHLLPSALTAMPATCLQVSAGKPSCRHSAVAV